jgi:hypothetical protein
MKLPPGDSRLFSRGQTNRKLPSSTSEKHPIDHCRNAYYAPHSHSGLTTHLILRGELTIKYPQDAAPKKETFGSGARLDVEIGREHEVWVGPEGCTSVIGE